MGKGATTKQAILDTALRVASTHGLEGLTVGELASTLDISKSGLFAHFGSKENLQLEVLAAAAERFTQAVFVPSIRVARGEPRVRALFERWLAWGDSEDMPGGCLFISSAFELDDRPGVLRDALVKTHRDLMDALGHAARLGVEEGHFRKDLDVAQFAFEMYSVVLGHHLHARLLKERRTNARTRTAFERLMAYARPPDGA